MRRSARMAVERWVQFPATADPRPTVLLHSPVRSEGGFTNGDAKNAFLFGAVEADEDVPDEPLRLLRSAGDGGHPPHAPLTITGAVLTEAPFATDRGEGTFSAWRIEAVDTLGPIWALAEVALDQCWEPPTLEEGPRGPHMLGSAFVGTDQRSLDVTFVGGREDLFRYDAEVVEAATAVTVVPLQRVIRKLPTAITFEGHRREVRVVLREALGGRVLVNLDGSPVPVLAL
jgi:hypothetical protein